MAIFPALREIFLCFGSITQSKREGNEPIVTRQLQLWLAALFCARIALYVRPLLLLLQAHRCFLALKEVAIFLIAEGDGALQPLLGIAFAGSGEAS